jgi:hypothetical protein
MTEAPEKMWVFPKADWFNAGASNVRLSSAGANDVEYTRSDIAEAEVARLTAEIRVLKRDLFYCFPTEFEYED